jgi:hypothetical protein
MDKKKEQEVKLDILLDEEIAQGVYANLAAVNHSDTEFTLDFIFVQPQSPRARVRSRVITSPRHARRLLLALEENIRKYEKKFGPIDPDPKGAATSEQVGNYH